MSAFTLKFRNPQEAEFWKALVVSMAGSSRTPALGETYASIADHAVLLYRVREAEGE